MKKFIFFLLTAFFFTYCSRNNYDTVKDIMKSKHIKLIKTIKWDYNKTGYILGELQFSDSLTFYCTASYRKKIYKIDISASKNINVIQVGRRGKGPGEYIKPRYLYNYNDCLYFFSNRKLKSIKNNGIGSTELKNIVQNPFIVTKNYIISNTRIFSRKYDDSPESNALIKIFSRQTGKLLKKLVYINNMYRYLYHIKPGDICYDENKKILYTAYAAPFKINRIRINNKFKELKPWNLEEYVGNEFISMKENHYIKIKKANRNAEVRDIYGEFHKLQYLDIINSNGNKYLLSILYKEFNGDLLCYLIKDDGKIMDKFSIKKYQGFGVFENKIYLLRKVKKSGGTRYNILDIYKVIKKDENE